MEWCYVPISVTGTIREVSDQCMKSSMEGEYDGVPIVGGLAEMDRRYKRKWRSGDIGYQRAFSRLQQICKAVEIEVGKGKSLEAVLDDLDELFVEKECKGLEKMRELVSGILPKKSRAAGQGSHQPGVV